MIKSSEDKSVARASAESEAHSTSSATSRGARELELGEPQRRLGESDQRHLHEDNQAAIRVANNGRSYSDETRRIKRVVALSSDAWITANSLCLVVQLKTRLQTLLQSLYKVVNS